MGVAENVRRKNDRRPLANGQKSDADAVDCLCVLNFWQTHGHRYSSTHQWRRVKTTSRGYGLRLASSNSTIAPQTNRANVLRRPSHPELSARRVVQETRRGTHGCCSKQSRV